MSASAAILLVPEALVEAVLVGGGLPRPERQASVGGTTAPAGSTPRRAQSSSSRRTGSNQRRRRAAGALGTGIFAGYVFVIPGLAAVSIAGLMDIPLGLWLVYGLVLGPLTAIVTTLIFRWLLRGRYWKADKDEEVDEAMVERASILKLAIAAWDKGRPFVIDSISRYKSSGQQKETVKKLAKGEPDKE